GSDLASMTAEARSCTFDYEGKRLLTGHVDGIRLWDVPACRQSGFHAGEDVWFALFEPTSKHVVTGGPGGIKEWDLMEDGESAVDPFKLRRILSRSDPHSLALSRDGTLIAFCADGGLNIVPLSGGVQQLVFEMPANFSSLAFGQD